MIDILLELKNPLPAAVTSQYLGKSGFFFRFSKISRLIPGKGTGIPGG